MDKTLESRTGNELAELPLEKRHAMLRAILRDDFHSFVRKVFETVAPGDRFSDAWYVRAIAHTLDRVARGEARRVIINVPPRSLKSICASVALPAFVLGHNPRRRIICVSYSDDLAKKFASDFRAVLRSDWYQRTFPHTRIDRAKDNESEVRTTQRGSEVLRAMSTNRRMRCAIYTRTSSDEHLDQEFNSLHAQREACEAFIRSQSGEGWQLSADRYEDGGFSGGTMERPDLQKLLEQIRDGRIDVIVVYKIDRLTRSLMDFARIVEILDAHGVSFVSVTQAFNTTTSMGRLTLNVLLSFAQFEREVTAERIRDKIAASKKKGLWMGGNVPLGYRVENRKLLIDEVEAATIRHIFHRYLELKSIRKLADEINRSEWVIRRGPPRNGTHYISDAFRAGNLRHLLANPVYVGKIRHRDKIYEGEHDGIIDQETFERVQVQLKEQAPKRRHPTNTQDVHLLTGILFDETGDRLTPSHTRNRGVRYRYYVSKRIVDRGRDPASPYAGWRIRAGHIDTIVEDQLLQILSDSGQLMEWFGNDLDSEQITQLTTQTWDKQNQWTGLTGEQKRKILQHLFARITVRVGWIRFELDRGALITWLMGRPRDSLSEEKHGIFELEQPMSVRRRGVESRMVMANGASMPRPDAALIDFVVRANTYLAALTDGSAKSLTQVAREQGTVVSEVSRLLPFAFLAPQLVESILAGNQPFELGALRLSRIADLPVSWEQQAGLFGF